jgi:ATP-dependent DNA helicase RecG
MHLGDAVTVLPQVSDRYAKILAKLNISTLQDLLTHFPRYHRDNTAIVPLSSIQLPGSYLTTAKVSGVISRYLPGKRSMQAGKISDGITTVKAMWFNQPYLVNAFKPGVDYYLQVNVKQKGKQLAFYPISFEPLVEDREPVHLGRLTPQYRLTAGISPKWLRNRLKYLVDRLDQLDDLVTLEILDQMIASGLGVEQLSTRKLLAEIHFPEEEAEIEDSRGKLGVLEISNLQLRYMAARSGKKKVLGIPLSLDAQQKQQFWNALPFEPTVDQRNAILEIWTDLIGTEPMQRMLQGDVGSGKTIVAAAAAYAAAANEQQAIILAPTTILASQHYRNFTKLFANMGIEVALVTAETELETAAQIIIGTSAVLARKHKILDNPAMIIVDEQHRFGVRQREELLEPLGLKHPPHFLHMTATPIPRSLALTLFGETQVSEIKTKPAGRQPVLTRIAPVSKLADMYTWIAQQVEQGGQVYWVCPAVEENEESSISSAKKTFRQLQAEVFPNLKVGLLHGKIKPAEKEETMQAFARGEINILVCTTVIEVGIDVAAANVIVIESPERYGLAQLHQLRGRVGRGVAQSWCILLAGEQLLPTNTFNSETAADPTSIDVAVVRATEDADVATVANPDAAARLEYFATHNDGMDVAMYDLARRGPGEVYGLRQSGVPDLKVANITDLDQIRQARALADSLWSQGVKQIPLFAHSFQPA